MKARRRGLAERREMLGYSQEKLAEVLGVELTTVGRWERGETFPQPWSRPKLVDALEVSPEELHRLLVEGRPTEVHASDGTDEPVDDPERDPVR